MCRLLFNVVAGYTYTVSLGNVTGPVVGGFRASYNDDGYYRNQTGYNPLQPGPPCKANINLNVPNSAIVRASSVETPTTSGDMGSIPASTGSEAPMPKGAGHLRDGYLGASGQNPLPKVWGADLRGVGEAEMAEASQAIRFAPINIDTPVEPRIDPAAENELLPDPISPIRPAGPEEESPRAALPILGRRLQGILQNSS
jgi:hypothetical protein